MRLNLLLGTGDDRSQLRLYIFATVYDEIRSFVWQNTEYNVDRIRA